MWARSMTYAAFKRCTLLSEDETGDAMTCWEMMKVISMTGLFAFFLEFLFETACQLSSKRNIVITIIGFKETTNLMYCYLGSCRIN